MCSPTATMVMMVASTAMSMVGAAQASKARQRQYQAKSSEAAYKAKVARNNATVAEWQAEDARARAARKTADHQRKVDALAGRQRAVMAASGFAIDDDEIDILGDTAYFGKVDQLALLQQGEREAYQHKVAASNASAQGLLYDYSSATFASEAAAESPLFAAAGAGLSGGSSVAQQWYKFDKAGAWA